VRGRRPFTKTHEICAGYYDNYTGGLSAGDEGSPLFAVSGPVIVLVCIAINVRSKLSVMAQEPSLFS
jgi:hypothetical protein